MSWVWDWFQQSQITENATRVAQAHASASAAGSRIDELEKKLETLSLLCRALVEELEKTTGLNQDQIRARMLDIDLRDGKEDGKYDPHASASCPGCGRKIMKHRGGCMWCGHKL